MSGELSSSGAAAAAGEPPAGGEAGPGSGAENGASGDVGPGAVNGSKGGAGGEAGTAPLAAPIRLVSKGPSGSRRAKLPSAAARNSAVLEGGRGITLRGVGVIAPELDGPDPRARRARELAAGLAGCGLPVTAITLRRGELPLREQQGLVRVFRIPVAGGRRREDPLGLLEAGALAVVVGRLRRLNLLYALDPRAGAVAARVGRAVSMPVVLRLAGSGSFGAAAGVLASPERELQLAALRGAARVAVADDGAAREATTLLGLRADHLARVPEWVDLAAFRPRPWAESTPPRLAFVGSLDASARVDVLLDAMARLVATHDLPGLELCVVGDGPDLRALQARAAALDLGARVRFLGAVDDVVTVLRDARLCVVPQAAEEDAQAAVLEALATGVPVVAARSAGVEELLRHEVEGLLVRPGDAEDLSAALARLLDDRALEQRLAGAARARAEGFGLEDAAAHLVELFTEVGVARDERPMDGTPVFPGVDAGQLLRGLAGASARAALEGARWAGGMVRLRRAAQP